MIQSAWPPLACLSLLVVVVIILILKFGHRCFGTRVTTLPQPWERPGSQYQYQMQVLDTSLKQPLDPRHLPQHQHHHQQRYEVEQFEDDDIDTRLQYGAGEDYEPQFESHSREAAV